MPLRWLVKRLYFSCSFWCSSFLTSSSSLLQEINSYTSSYCPHSLPFSLPPFSSSTLPFIVLSWFSLSSLFLCFHFLSSSPSPPIPPHFIFFLSLISSFTVTIRVADNREGSSWVIARKSKLVECWLEYFEPPLYCVCLGYFFLSFDLFHIVYTPTFPLPSLFYSFSLSPSPSAGSFPSLSQPFVPPFPSLIPPPFPDYDLCVRQE